MLAYLGRGHFCAALWLLVLLSSGDGPGLRAGGTWQVTSGKQSPQGWSSGELPGRAGELRGGLEVLEPALGGGSTP